MSKYLLSIGIVLCVFFMIVFIAFSLRSDTQTCECLVQTTLRPRIIRHHYHNNQHSPRHMNIAKPTSTPRPVQMTSPTQPNPLSPGWNPFGWIRQLPTATPAPIPINPLTPINDNILTGF